MLEPRFLKDFPTYTVSTDGHIFNTRWDRHVVQRRSTRGHMAVVLSDEEGRQHTKSVARLVAEAFNLERFRSDCRFIAHKNRYKEDCSLDNLAWRPKWFVINYHQYQPADQMKHPDIAVLNRCDGLEFDNTYIASEYYCIEHEAAQQSLHDEREYSQFGEYFAFVLL